MTDEKNFFEEGGENTQEKENATETENAFHSNNEPTPPQNDPAPEDRDRAPFGQPTPPPYGGTPFGGTPYGQGGYQSFSPNPQEPKKPKKNKFIGWIIGLAALYLLLIVGLFALIYSGALSFQKEEGNVTVETQETPKKTEEEKEKNEPIHENSTGENGIVSEDYTGEVLSAATLYENNVDCVVFVEANYRQGKATGSGFVIDAENGYILTNHHVVEDCTDIAVTFKNSDSYVAKYVGGDEINDIAVLKVEAKGLKHVTIGNSDELRVGEDILIIGNPLGDLTFSMARGIVSAIDRSINTGEHNIKTFQTDTAINSGNSGGPAFDSTGAVVGIASAKYAATGVEGIGFCIPINDAMRIAKDLVNHGYVTGRPNFGITVSDSQGYEYTIDEYGRRVLVETAKGARVEEVAKNSCAAKGGLQAGDVITKLGSKTITSANQLINEKNTYKAGDTVTLEVYRKGQTVTLTITLDEYTPQ